MPKIDAGNPYQAPEARLESIRGAMACPPVYAAISLLCWAVGLFHFAGSLLLIGIAIRNGLHSGWEFAFGRRDDHLVGLVILGLGILSTVAYLAAGRSLRDNQGRPGLILCGMGIGMTYLIIWLGGRS